MQKFGLALGGGGTKGAYHIGVWEALKEMEINVVAITGTSIGSVNGALLAQGSYKKAKKLWLGIGLDDVINLNTEDAHIGENLLNIKNIGIVLADIHKNNGLDSKPLKLLLENLIDENKLKKSKIDFGLVCYELDSLEETALFKDEIPKDKLIDYLMASASLPGLKKTVINNKKYIDGAVTNNIPCDLLIQKGIENIISVDVGGFGFVKGIAPKGINVINIKSSDNIIGHLDFNHKNIEMMMKQGYFDCLKAFGRVLGNIYSFNISDYHNNRLKYSQNVMKGIEYAAKIYNIDKYKIYKFSDLTQGVIKAYLFYKEKYQNTQGISLDSFKVDEKLLLTRLVNYIMGDRVDDFATKFISGIVGNIGNAANSIAYFISLN